MLRALLIASTNRDAQCRSAGWGDRVAADSVGSRRWIMAPLPVVDSEERPSILHPTARLSEASQQWRTLWASVDDGVDPALISFLQSLDLRIPVPAAHAW
jgi:hypothetical protein